MNVTKSKQNGPSVCDDSVILRQWDKTNGPSLRIHPIPLHALSASFLAFHNQNFRVSTTSKMRVIWFFPSSPMRIQGLSWFLLISLFQIQFVARVSTRCLDDQRVLLLQLKKSLVFDSTSSTKLVNWNESDDCCKWDGVDCDGAGHVISLDLADESISGGIENSTGLFGLQYLQKLNLAFNFFTRTQIPKGLQKLTNLSYLNLSNAGFGGQVPMEVSTLRSLVILDLSAIFGVDQPLKLENPNLQMLLQNLPELRELYLDYVNVSAQKSEWCQALASSLPDLTTLSLRSCGLSGPLDSSLAGLHSLSVLRLDGNNLSTTVPEFIANFSNLTTLTLGNCFLQGTFPDIIFQVPTLQTLDLSYNRLLSGTIPQYPLSSSFKTMVLSYTNFSGLLPDSIGNLPTLSKIDLSNCNFEGVMSTISNLTELVYLDFSVNSFNGSIPLFSMSKRLEYIDLSGNYLTGSLSSKHFEGLSNLVYIILGSNFLSGNIPPSLFDLPSLQKLQLSNNKFSGQIDEFPVSNPFILGTLDLSSNQLEGSIPESFFKLKGLSVLSLSSNLFNGTLKLEMIQRLGNLTRLDLGYNKLSIDTSNSNLFGLPRYLSRLNLASCNLYNFPHVRNLSNLAFLDLSSNHIKGEIPSWIWTIGGGALYHLNLSHNFLQDLQKPVNMPPFLTLIDIHSNRLQGELPVPPELASYVDYSSNNFQQPIPVHILNSTSLLTFFSLANNSLNGTIPASLCNAIYLQVLDLSDNHLSGSIPPCLVGRANIGVLNLRRNNISGDIPDAFSHNCSLKTLDISNNKLEGKIPPSLANCKSLEVMNAGNNKIDDTFPCRLKYSSSLRVLVLRNNKFHGDLSCSEVNGSWPNLQIIDIASNNFSGKLYPRYFASWRGMVLDDNARFRGDHLQFEFLDLSNLYYQDAVTVTLKGQEMELVKILTIFTVIDFSGNKFSGEIPQTVGDLSSLYVLNLSHNAFTGKIPNTIGNLKQLGSLDLSANNLSGEIPKQLTNLNFLSFLNLSYNKLVGMIPTGSQFQTFSAENFEGNSGLCGFPLAGCDTGGGWPCGYDLDTGCDSDAPEGNSAERLNKREYDWQLIITGLGYGVGLLSVFVPAALLKQWREYYSNQLDRFLTLIFPTLMKKHTRRMNNRM
ncbi:hypothetical protein C2S51_034839 [Perilla frutescens var. frutescens]|nr:hypothetical protein C2S51_034839 [Perilla frutescens var. frutescens]